MTSQRGGGRARVVANAAGLAALLLVAHLLDARAWLVSALEWIRGLGPWAPVVFCALYVVACVLLLPGSVLSVGAGAVFGLVKGIAVVSISATLGATAAFLVGRYVARGWVERTIAADSRFQAIDAAVAREVFARMLATAIGQAVIALQGQWLVAGSWAAGVFAFVLSAGLLADDLFLRVEIGYLAGALLAATAIAVFLFQRMRAGVPDSVGPLVEALEHEPLEI